MNIMFVMKVFEIGGQETVTSVLANCFVDKGHSVHIVSFEEPSRIMLERLDKRIRFHYAIGDYKFSKSNVTTIRKILIDNDINLVINQWGLHYVIAKIVKKARLGLDIKLISVYHNSPSSNARIKDVEISIDLTRNIIKKSILNFKKKLFIYITSMSMRYVYTYSDVYQILSPRFIEEFKIFTGIENPDKLMVQTNPLTIDSNSFTLDISSKHKEIIYVGRIDYNQKRVNRVIDTWVILEKKFPEWRLTIVGDGEDRKTLEKQVFQANLKNVSFEGFQYPVKYYERASILILTSEYEGFPLVLAESMSFGVVPAVYGSYSAVYDIIEDSTNGIILPYKKDGFEAAQMAKRLSNIMESPFVYQSMAANAKQRSMDFSLDVIYASWEKLFEKLK